MIWKFLKESTEDAMKDLLKLFHWLGSLAAVILSYTTFHSILWAILAFLFGWFYVIYYFLAYGTLAPLALFVKTFMGMFQ